MTALEPSVGAGTATASVSMPRSTALPGALARVSDAMWRRLAILGILALAALTYLWNLSLNGYGNDFYAAAALAGSKDWVAWFFGSFDAGNFITVDKPPASLWVMGLSVRLFGLSSWSLLVPQAVMGVATVGILHATVRRSFGTPAGLLAALLMAVTPVAVLMFRFDNPDALLVLLMVAAAWALTRSLEHGSLRWVALSATFIGFAFLTKSLQAYLVLPGFALVWLIAAAGGLRHRIVGLLVAGVTVFLASAWWVAIVELTPKDLRPYIGGSENDSALDLIFGYNGLARILGGEGPGGGGGVRGGAFGGGDGFGGTPGIWRLFNEGFGGQITWLLPLAVLAIPVGLCLYRRAGRTHPAVGDYLLWGSWLAVTALTFSFMSGIIHEYYTVALAPAVAALSAGVIVDLWRRRGSRVASVALAAGVAVTAWWASQLLARTPDFWPGLGTAVLVAGLVAAAGLVLTALLPRLPARNLLRGGALTIAMVAMLAGPVAYAAETVTSSAQGSIALAGPATASGPGGFGGRGFPGGTLGTDGRTAPDGTTAPGGTTTPGGTTAPGGTARPGGFFAGGFPGDMGVDQATTDYLVANQGDATWIVAVSGSQAAAPLELSTGLPVMAMGGFGGSDPTPTLDELTASIGSGELRFVIAGGRQGFGGGFGPGGTSSSAISTWVTSSCTLVTVEGSSSSTLYDCVGAVPAS